MFTVEVTLLYHCPFGDTDISVESRFEGKTVDFPNKLEFKVSISR